MAKGKKMVVVRTYGAGVHFGELVDRTAKEVTLANARRIWQWKGAYTLNEVATKGVAAGSRVSVPAPSIILTEAIEIIECTAKGAANLTGAQWAS